MFMRANVYDMDLCNNTVKKCGSWYLTGWPHLFYKKRGKCKCQVDRGTAWRCLGCREKGHISPGPRLWFQVVLYRLVKALITLLCRSDGSLSLLEKTLTFDSRAVEPKLKFQARLQACTCFGFGIGSNI